MTKPVRKSAFVMFFQKIFGRSQPKEKRKAHQRAQQKINFK